MLDYLDKLSHFKLSKYYLTLKTIYYHDMTF